jgi:tetratricopeptide (TPR) repeat protein
LIREKLPLVAIALVSSVITYLAQQSGGAVQSLGGFPLKVRIYNALVSYVAYIGKMFWPSGLAAYYQYRVLPHLQILLCLLLLLVVTAAAVRWARRFPYVLFGWLWYVGTLVPVIGLVQVGSQSMADRYTYVPFIGLFIAAAWAATDLVSRFRNLTIPTAIAGGLIVCALAMVSWRQVQYWKDGITLWQRALEIDSGNQTAHQNLAYDLWRAGRLDEAATHYREALRISPNFAIAHANLGLVLSDQGQFDEAIEHYEKALQLNVPKTPFQQIHTNLGIAYAKKNQDDKALPHYEEALRFDPSYAVAHLSIGNVYARQGKTADAIKEYKEALRLQPGLAVAQQNIDNLSRMSASPEALYKSAMSLAAQGKMDEAAAQLREALKLAPDYAEAHADLGTVLGNQGKLDEAITHFREAVRLKPDYGPAKANLEKALKLVEKNK